MILLIAAHFAGGCTYPARGSLAARLAERVAGTTPSVTNPPRLRLGSMPFDVWYSPLVLRGPDDLGTHRHRAGRWPGSAADEIGRGILYGNRCGFLDLAHVRNAIDLTRFVYEPVHAALDAGRPRVVLMSTEPDRFQIVLADARALTASQRRTLARAIARRVAYLMTTWHEIATGYGYKSLVFITERPSAFSYDDPASHMVGVGVASEALRDDPALKDFDRAVTQTLNRHLRDLGVVDSDQVRPHLETIAGRWHDHHQPRLRIIHLGLPGEPLWARTLGDAPPAVWGFAADEAVAGRAVDAWYGVRIGLHLDERDAILAAVGRLGSSDTWIDPPRDFPLLRIALRRAFLPVAFGERHAKARSTRRLASRPAFQSGRQNACAE